MVKIDFFVIGAVREPERACVIELQGLEIPERLPKHRSIRFLYTIETVHKSVSNNVTGYGQVMCSTQSI